MSQQNVEAFGRGVDAYNRRDAAALLAELDPDIEWHPALLVGLGGETTVYRGHRGVRDLLRDIDETLAEIHVEFPDVRDLGDRIVAEGRLRVRGKSSGVVTEADVGYVADFRRGKATRIRTYLHPGEALKAVGLSE
jgi:ketosteroid isomerase-like protein